MEGHLLQPREDWDLASVFPNCRGGFWHEGYCIGGLRGGHLFASPIRSLPWCEKSHRAGDGPFSLYLRTEARSRGL